MSLFVNIKKSLGNFRLDVSLEHEEGVLGLLGASGCGKSITLQCIAGIVTPDEGRIVLNGRVLFDSREKINLKPQQRNVGYLFQDYALFPNMTIRKNILCGLNKIKDKYMRTQKLKTSAELMHIEDQLDKYPDQLSGGQKQRAALARILVSEPELLLLDEPFSALDSFLRDELQIQIKKLLEEFGKDVLLVSHSRDEVYHLCKRLALIDNGSLIKYGNTKEVFADPESVKGCVLTGCKNTAKARKIDEHTVEVTDWGITLKTQNEVKDDLTAIGIRAHYFNTDCKSNRYKITCLSEMQEPFESTIMFRYEGQPKESPDIWWRMTKEKRPHVLPEYLGIAPQNVLLLYD